MTTNKGDIELKILTGFAIINDRNGKRVTYTYDILDERGNVLDSNKKESYVVLEDESKSAIDTLESIVENRMNDID